MALFSQLLRRKSKKSRPLRKTSKLRKPNEAPLGLEQLEARQMLATLYWDPAHSGGTSLGGSGSWLGANNWWNGTSNVSWSAGDDAVFDGTIGTVTLGSAVSAASLSFLADGYTVSGSSLSLTGGSTTISAAQSATISSAINASSNQRWTVGASETLTVSGVTSGSTSVTKAGAGTLTVSASNTFTGGTFIEEGTLKLGKANALATTTAITFGSSSTNGSLELNGFNQQVAGLVVASGATAASQVIGNSHASTDARLTYSSASGPTSTFGGTIQDKITGAGTRKTAVTVAAGALNLTGSNTYTGGTNINGGSVEFASGSLGSSGLILFGGDSTLSWATGNSQDISGRFRVNEDISATLDIGANNVTFATATSNYGSIVKEGSGTLLLTATISSTWGTATVNGGVLKVGTGGTVGSLNFSTIVTNSSLVFHRSNAVNQNSLITGSGSISQMGAGSLNLSNASNAFSGGLNLLAGTVEFTNGALGSSGAISFSADSTLRWSTGNAQDISSRIAIANGVTATLDTAANNVTLATGFGGGGSGAVKKAGSGSLTLAAANSYTGITTVNAGTLNVTATDGIVGGLAIGNGTSVSFASGSLGSSGTVTLSGTSSLQWATGNAQDLSSRIALSNGAISTLNLGSNNVSFASGFGGGSTGKLIKSGSGKLTLSGTNGYTGGTQINGGTVEFVSGGLGTSGSVTVAGNAEIIWASGNADDLSGRLFVNDTITATLDIGSNNVTFASSTSFYGSFIKEGSGTLLLTNNLLSSWGTATISQGVFRLGNGGTSGFINFGNIVNNSSLVFDRSDIFTFDDPISGSGSVTKLGTGTVDIGNVTNSYTGGTYIYSGVVEFQEGSLGSAGPIQVKGNATIRWWANSFYGNQEDISDRLLIDSGVTATLDTFSNLHNVVFASSFGGVGGGSVHKIGGGSLTFSAENDYLGSTVVDAGTLIYEDDATIAPGGLLLVNNNAAVHFHDGLTFDSDALLVLAGSADVYFVGDSLVNGTGQILVTTADARIWARGVDSSTAATLTVGSNVWINGLGAIDGYYSGDDFVNYGKIVAEDGTLEIALPYVNEGMFAAAGEGRVDRGGTELHGKGAAVSGTELLLFWTDLTPSAVTYHVQISGNGVNYITAGVMNETDETYLFDGLAPNTTYYLRLTAFYSGGETEVYDSGPVTTLNLYDTSGWYQVRAFRESNGAPFEQVNPGVGNVQSGVHAGSAAGAIIKSFPRLVRDGSVPTTGGDGFMSIYQNAPGHEYRFSYDPNTPEGDLSIPIRFILYSLGLDGAANAAMSDDPVRYFDGAVEFGAADLVSTGLGGAFGQTRSWTASFQWSEGQRNGIGWINDSLPTIRAFNGQNSISIVRGAMNIETFEKAGGEYVPMSYTPESLNYDAVNDEYTWDDSEGNEIAFYGFGVGTPTGRAGKFKSMSTAGGVVTEVADWTADGAVEEIRRRDADDNELESWIYEYLASPDPNAGMLESVTWRQANGSGGWNAVRKAEYEYYDGVEEYGNVGDLKIARIKDADDNAIDASYYRYYTEGEAGGYVHGLKYAFDANSFARLVAALGNPELAGDSLVAPYAQHYFEFDESRRAVRHDIQSIGGGISGGIGTFTYEYFVNEEFSSAANSWVYKTIETLPDGNLNVFYCNNSGAPILKEFQDVSDPINPSLTGERWLTYYQYDALGRLALKAEPSAVLDYDFDIDNDLVIDLAASEGLIELTEYYTTTTATDTSAGGVVGYLKSTKIKHGASGTPILTAAHDYFLKSEDSRINVVSASESVYANTNGTGAQTTNFAYAWFTDTVAIASLTASLPTISSGQHGSGAANAVVVHYDRFGRVIWEKDAGGYLNYTEYDAVTGAISKVIVDVDTDNAADFDELPSGWTTPSGGGLHLATVFETDALGRVTKHTDPAGNVTYTVYNDLAQEVRIYRGWNAVTNVPTGPVEVRRHDRSNNYTEVLTFYWDDSGLPVDLLDRPNGSESLADPKAVIQSLSRTLFNDAGQAVETRVYSSLDGVSYSASTSLGLQGANYLSTLADYVDWGWLAMVVDATGTARHTFFDALGRSTQEWTGVDDVPSTDYNGDSVVDREDFRWWVAQNPTELGGPAGTSMQKTVLNVYDHGEAGGDSNLTEKFTFFGAGSGEYYLTNYEYDWRNRQIGSLGPDGVAALLSLDNLGRITQSQAYANSTYLSGEIIEGDLRGQQQWLYDSQNRVYESRAYEVDVNPSTGDGIVGDYLAKRTWYDSRGNVAKEQTGIGAFTKFSYDGAGREIANYLAFDDAESHSDYGAALDVSGDTVVEQNQQWYDAANRLVAAATFKRLPDDVVSTGALTAVNAYVSAAAMAYDAAHRLIYEVQYGRQDVLGLVATELFDLSGDLIDGNSNGVPDIADGAPPEPDSSDDYLVTKYVFAPRISDVGEIVRTIDNAGRIQETQRDLAGRTVRTIANYNNGVVAETEVDQDITAEYEYDWNGRLSTVIALNPKGSGNGIEYQKTRYLYESTINALLPTKVVAADSTDVLSQDLDTLEWSIDADNGDHQSTNYDWMNRVVSKTDQRGVVHQYSFDAAGRLAADAVTNLGLVGENVDGAVRRIGYSYDEIGRRQFVTSYSDVSGTTVVNEIGYAYDGWGNLIQEWQAHGGSVNLLTSPSVDYLYDDGASGGEAAHIRRTDVVYPNGRHVVYDYGATGSIDDMLSRVKSIGDGSSAYSTYDYLGADMIVSEDYEEAEVKLDHSANNFAAYDRFGRVLDQTWSSYGLSPGVIDEYSYTYDRSSNRTSRVNALESALTQLYEFDDLNQLISAERNNGDDQAWELDGLGNWSSFDDDGSVQTRETNAANEIVSATGMAAPDYDRAGNTISTPKPGDESNSWTLAYDAWNRLVSATDGTTTVTFEYDAEGRRIAKVTSSTEEHYFYDGEQVVETQTPDNLNVLQPAYQYAWSLRYVDSPILRDTYSGGTVVSGDRLYYLTDANHNVTAVVDNSGVVQERYDYDAYGAVTVYDANWANAAMVSALANSLLFAGQDVDAETGLRYARARWYNSSIGSFLSRDPSGFAAGDLNLYRYVENNPVIFVDPSGLYAIGGRIAIAGAAGAAAGAASGAVTGGIVGGPGGAAAGAAAGAILGGIAGIVGGALESPCASTEDLILTGAVDGLLAGAPGGAAAGAAAKARKAAKAREAAKAANAALNEFTDDFRGIVREGNFPKDYSPRPPQKPPSGYDGWLPPEDQYPG